MTRFATRGRADQAVMLIEIPPRRPCVHSSIVPNFVSLGGSYGSVTGSVGCLLLSWTTMTPHKNAPDGGIIPAPGFGRRCNSTIRDKGVNLLPPGRISGIEAS